MADLRVDPAGPAAAAVAAYLDVALPTAPSTYVESRERHRDLARPRRVADHQPVPHPGGTGDRAAGGGLAGRRGRRSTSPRSAPRCGCAASTSATCSPEAARSTCTRAVFRARRCAQTLLGQAGVVLMALDDTGTALPARSSARRSPATSPTGCSTPPPSTAPPADPTDPPPQPHHHGEPGVHMSTTPRVVIIGAGDRRRQPRRRADRPWLDRGHGRRPGPAAADRRLHLARAGPGVPDQRRRRR